MIQLRELLRRMLLMLSISGLIHCHVTPRVYPSMNHHMSFRQRKSVSNNGKMKKWLSARKCSILSSILVFPPFSSQGNMHKCDQDLTKIYMVLNPKLLRDLVTIMGSLEVHLVGQEDIHQAGTLVEDTITLIGEVKEGVAMAAGLILLKGEGHLMVPAACLVVVLAEEVVVAMESEPQLIPSKGVHMVGLALVVAQT